MKPTVADAKARRIVRLADGRTARLVYWPIPRERRRAVVRKGAKAIVLLPGGKYLGVSPESITRGTARDCGHDMGGGPSRETVAALPFEAQAT